MITQIEIGGYRLLDEFVADLNPLTVVIGANAVGKSTLIDCLQLIAQCSTVPVNTAIGWHGASSLLTVGNENRQLTWKITFHEPATWEASPLDKKQALVYEVVLQADELGLQMQPQYEVLRTRETLLGYSDPLKFLEVTPYQRHIFDIEQRRLIPFDEAQSSPDVVRESDSAEAISRSGLQQPAQQEPALLLSQIRFFNEFPIPSRARVLLESMAFYPDLM